MKCLQKFVFIALLISISNSILAHRFSFYNESSKVVRIVNVKFLMADNVDVNVDILPDDRVVIDAPARLSQHCLEGFTYIFNPDTLNAAIKTQVFDIPLCLDSVIPIEEPPMEEV